MLLKLRFRKQEWGKWWYKSGISSAKWKMGSPNKKKRFTVSSKHADSTGKNMWFVHSFSNKHEEYRNANVKSTKKTDGISSGIYQHDNGQEPTWQRPYTDGDIFHCHPCLPKSIWGWLDQLEPQGFSLHLRRQEKCKMLNIAIRPIFWGQNTHFLCTVVQ